MSKRRPASRPCPCGLPASYEQCCGRLHSGAAAATTAEELMRSRFSAFTAQDAAYLRRTWHSNTRPAQIDFEPGLRWTGLEIVDTAEGSAFHTKGVVEFVAHYTHAGAPGEMRERSRFVREDGAWVYLDAEG